MREKGLTTFVKSKLTHGEGELNCSFVGEISVLCTFTFALDCLDFRVCLFEVTEKTLELDFCGVGAGRSFRGGPTLQGEN